jgi:uncharacterized protein
VKITEGVLVGGEHFTLDGDAASLTVARCTRCEATVFPVQTSCPRCPTGEMVLESLDYRGTLWSFTIQRFQPKSPYDGAMNAQFIPFGVGYVDFGGVIVEGRLTENDPARLSIGQTVTTVLQSYAVDDRGTSMATFAFRPID